MPGFSNARSQAVWLSIIVVAVTCTAVVICRHRVAESAAIAQIYEGVPPVPKNGAVIPIPVLNEIIARDFKFVTNLRYVPPVVKDSFCNVEHCEFVGSKFDMVNPGKTMSTDLVIKGVPNKRLVFAALSRQSAIVLYQRGGYGDTLRVTVLNFRDGSAWRARLNDYAITTLPKLRDSLSGGEYTVDAI